MLSDMRLQAIMTEHQHSEEHIVPKNKLSIVRNNMHWRIIYKKLQLFPGANELSA